MTSQPTDPQTAIEVRREEDDEPLGLLLPRNHGQWVPATIFGAALGPASAQDLAESLVREHGLSSLADPWWVLRDGEWDTAWLLEVKPDRIRLRWTNRMLVQAGHGEWVTLDTATVQRHRP